MKNKDVELIILNNGSTDSTSLIIEEYSKKLRMVVINRISNQRGTPTALQLISKAKGQWIICPGDDDVFIPTTLCNLPAILKKVGRGKSLVPFSAETIDGNGNKTPILFHAPREDNQIKILAQLMFKSVYWFPATCFRKEMVDNVVAPRTITVFDWWLWITAITKGKPEPKDLRLIQYRIHDGQEQKSFMGNMWKLDRLLSFNQIINDLSLSNWFNNATASEKRLFFVECVKNLYQQESEDFIEQVVILEIAQRLLKLGIEIDNAEINLLIKSGIDPRFLAVFLSKEVTEEMLITGVRTLAKTTVDAKDIAPSNTSERIALLENIINAQLRKTRNHELSETISPFEWKVLRSYRTLKQLSFVRWLIRR